METDDSVPEGDEEDGEGGRRRRNEETGAQGDESIKSANAEKMESTSLTSGAAGSKILKPAPDRMSRKFYFAGLRLKVFDTQHE